MMRASTLAGLTLGIGLGAGALWRRTRSRAREADLRGQVAVVTGGSRGLGLLVARELAREGCKLAICARDEAELRRGRKDLEARGAEVLAVPCDVAVREEVATFIARVQERFGRIDLLVNNAGIIQVGPVETTRLEDYEDAMGVMYWGAVYPTLAVLPAMLERRSGHVVTITSVGGKVAVPHLLPYASAKFAAVGFSEGLRAETLGKGVDVTTVVPGLMRTGSGLNALVKGKLEAEFAWFGVLASLPFFSIDAERAARQIVAAIKRGESEVILTLSANLLARFHGLFPGLSTELQGLANRCLLPDAEGGTRQDVRGVEVDRRLDSAPIKWLTRWSRSAAARFNELEAQ